MQSLVATARAAVRFALGAIMGTCFLVGTGHADPVGFKPGGVSCSLDVNRMDGSMSLGDLEQYENATEFNWAVLNNVPAATTGLPDDRTILFNASGASVDPHGDASAPPGATIGMTFNLRLLSINGAGGSKLYGIDNVSGSIFADNSRTTRNPAAIRFPTHVYLQATVQGTLGSALDIDLVSPPVYHLAAAGQVVFSKAEFRMFFDVDGDPATTNDRILIAKFGVNGPPDPRSSFASYIFINRAVVSFLVNWDSAMPGVEAS